ncbi:MAG: PorT family protein, partial [Prevotella sp.]|nr:PorT family protein [Prevotella sp.]
IKVGSTSVSPDNRMPFHIGVIADIPMARNFYIETGLFLQNKGFKMTDAKNNKLTCKPLYIEIPVLASCRLKLSDAMLLQLNAGPYIAHGLGGKAELRSPDGHVSIENDVFYREGEVTENYNRFDVGLQFGAGFIVYKHYYIGVAYDLGLIDTQKNASIITGPSGFINVGGFKAKNRSWTISLGYNF